MKGFSGMAKGAESSGRVKHEMSLARVDARFEEEERVETRPLSWSLIRRLLGYTRPYSAKRNALFIIVLLRSAQIPAMAWAISAIINGPISKHDPDGVFWGTVGFGVLAVVTQITMHFRQRWALELGESVVFDLRTAVYGHLMKQPMGFYSHWKLGNLISRLTSDIENVRAGVQNVLFVTLVQVGQMTGAAALMLFYNPILFSVVLFMAPVLWGVNRFFGKRIGQASRDLQESMSRVTASIAESVKGIRVTQGFSREQVNASLFRRLCADHAGYNMGLARNVALYIPLLSLNSAVFMAIILIVGGYGALSPDLQMPVGDLIAFFFLANLFFAPFQSLGQQYTQALSAMAGAERVFRLLDLEPEWADSPDCKPIPRIRGEVLFDDVSFAYEPGKPVLQEINFRANPGETIALVGHTGCGKSTIINLVSKFYLPTNGRVTIDGHEIRSISSESLHQQMGLVLQTNFLFSGTVMENIRLGKRDASDDDVRAAVKSLDLEDLIEAMPDRYETSVGERGSGLSVGQQQLVCFARAMLADPRILILDEATSAIDTITEARLQKALGRLLADRTSFVVAHRLSTIRHANLVLVLDHGRIIERGDHESLLALGGTYAELYEQFVSQ